MMTSSVIGIILFAVSLCADCFAVSLCSGVTVRGTKAGSVIAVALAFGVIQTGLLLAGWGFGYMLLGAVEKIAHILGFLLLLYVGGSMFLEGIRGGGECRDLSGLRNVILGGIATSIDALAAGISLSMDGLGRGSMLWQAATVFACTFISVVAGIGGGRVIGAKAGPIAEIAGACVLISIGIGILI